MASINPDEETEAKESLHTEGAHNPHIFTEHRSLSSLQPNPQPLSDSHVEDFLTQGEVEIPNTASARKPTGK